MAGVRRVVLNVQERRCQLRFWPPLKCLSVVFFCFSAVFLCFILVFVVTEVHRNYLQTEPYKFYLHETTAQTRPHEYTQELEVYFITEEAGTKRPLKKEIVVRYYLKACNCYKSLVSKYSKVSSFYPENLLVSSCSQEATLYGAGQSVVSYTLYVLNSKPNETEVSGLTPQRLLEMVAENLKRIREFYPAGSVMRVYSNVDLGGDFLCDLVCNNNDFFWCDIRNIPSHGDMSSMMYMTWRDLPLGDPTVDVFAIRDLDSYVIPREAAVVKDWLAVVASSKPIYVMRDKKNSHFENVLGGLWGGHNLHLGRLFSSILQERIIRAGVADRNYHHWGYSFDQNVLDKTLFTPFERLFVSYDSYHCDYYKFRTMVRPFPTRRGNGSDVVGISFGYPYDLEECPMECRPKYGKDWEYC